MESFISAPLFTGTCLVSMFVMLEVGRWAGRRQLDRDPERAMAGLGVIDSALFALFGLLIAFTFSGAAARFDTRRQLIAQEANDIGTAYLRLDLLAPHARHGLQELFRNYLDTRLAVYRALPDLQAARSKITQSEELQKQIWSQALEASRHPDAHVDAARLLLPALNAMIDISTTRTMASMIHPPNIIYALLFLLAAGCSLLAGFSMAEEKYRNWLHICAFAIIMGICLYVILELEYPRAGMLREDVYDQVLIDLRESMQLPSDS